MADVILKKISVFQEKGVGMKKIIGNNRRTITCTLTPSTMANFHSASLTQSLVLLPSWLLNLLGAGDVVVPGGYAAWNCGADFVKLLVPTLRARTRSLTGRRELFNQATLA